MTRTITPAEIKPGMRIRWEFEGITSECTVAAACANRLGGVDVTAPGDDRTYVWSESEVTVLAEPQPEEPTAFGARVVAGERKFVRGQNDVCPWVESLDGELYDWGDVCNEGQVTIIDADPSWTVPEQVKVAPVVPERIEEWPEDDTALRPYKWRGRDGYIWKWLAAASEWECYDAVGNGMVSGGRPSYGPWTRETDA